MNNQGDIPKFEPGPQLSASKLNEAFQLAIGQFVTSPGLLSSSSGNATRPLGFSKSGIHFQLLVGTTVTYVTTADSFFQLENLVEFCDRAGLPVAPIWVRSIPGGVNLNPGALVWAAYHRNFDSFDPGGGTVEVDWGMIPTGAADEKFRLVRGSVVVAVGADVTEFEIDNIELLAGTLDPAETPLTVNNVAGEAFADYETVVAIYNNTDGAWEVLRVERYRALRGTWYSGSENLTVKNVYMLDSSLDPRVIGGDLDEEVEVYNLPGDTYSSSSQMVYADWCVETNRWEARPRGTSSPGGGGGMFTCLITEEIDAGSAPDPSVGMGEVFTWNGTEWESIGQQTLHNPHGVQCCGSTACGLSGDSPGGTVQSEPVFVLTAPPMVDRTEEVVIEVTCDEENGLQYDTAWLTFMSPDCEGDRGTEP